MAIFGARICGKIQPELVTNLTGYLLNLSRRQSVL